jgi:hypothetical protein
MENNIKEIVNTYIKLKKTSNPNLNFDVNIDKDMENIYKTEVIMNYIKSDLNRILTGLDNIFIKN